MCPKILKGNRSKVRLAPKKPRDKYIPKSFPINAQFLQGPKLPVEFELGTPETSDNSARLRSSNTNAKAENTALQTPSANTELLTNAGCKAIAEAIMTSTITLLIPRSGNPLALSILQEDRMKYAAEGIPAFDFYGSLISISSVYY
ncbi:uncharacterized protein H6S33_003102 [Morchella sextelata]|jgi:hypothetical protein|uniref:uncharacterized protein n=1 Tax=Morchella sextelata TaxID=1174677 RepID=UPI001D039837|nr:uncharacterized protein H6S33_003102 [Morchella sextelata]KAH0607114.1 hypothetical protein H6S33_003102 [Morchella sextelata]